MDEARSEMLLQTGCYQVGSDGRQPTLVTVTRKCACRIHILCNGVSCYIPPIVAHPKVPQRRAHEGTCHQVLVLVLVLVLVDSSNSSNNRSSRK